MQHSMPPHGCVRIDAFVAYDAEEDSECAKMTGQYHCAKCRGALHGEGADRRRLGRRGWDIHGQHQRGKPLPIVSCGPHACPALMHAWQSSLLALSLTHPHTNALAQTRLLSGDQCMVMHNAGTKDDNARSHTMRDLSALRDFHAVS